MLYSTTLTLAETRRTLTPILMLKSSHVPLVNAGTYRWLPLSSKSWYHLTSVAFINAIAQRSSIVEYVSGFSQLLMNQFSNHRSSFIISRWHAHAGLQRSDGVFGSMVFRQAPQADVNSAHYDHDLPEHVIGVHDWFDDMTLAVYTAHRYGQGGHSADAILINGKGKRRGFLNPTNGETVYTDRETFNVTSGKRYRFRMFSNAIVICPLKISVDSHKLTIIASDGGSLEPYETDAFVIHGGERFDFVLDANQDIGNYWMRVEVRRIANIRSRPNLRM